MTESLPAFLQEKKEAAEEVNYHHNWLYSVVPAGSNGYVPYLAGYCKNCRKAFTVALPIDAAPGFYVEQQLDIPRWGCVGPELQ